MLQWIKSMLSCDNNNDLKLVDAGEIVRVNQWVGGTIYNQTAVGTLYLIVIFLKLLCWFYLWNC